MKLEKIQTLESALVAHDAFREVRAYRGVPVVSQELGEGRYVVGVAVYRSRGRKEKNPSVMWVPAIDDAQEAARGAYGLMPWVNYSVLKGGWRFVLIADRETGITWEIDSQRRAGYQAHYLTGKTLSEVLGELVNG